MSDFVASLRIPTYAELEAAYRIDPQQAFNLARHVSIKDETGLTVDGRDLTFDELNALRFLFGSDTPEKREQFMQFVLACARRSKLDFNKQGFVIIDGMALDTGHQAACTPQGDIAFDYDFFNANSLNQLLFAFAHETRHALDGPWSEQQRKDFDRLSYLEGAPRKRTRALVEKSKRNGLYLNFRHKELDSDIHAITMFDTVDEGLQALSALVDEMKDWETTIDGKPESPYRSLHPSPRVRLRHAYMHFKGHRPPKV